MKRNAEHLTNKNFCDFLEGINAVEAAIMQLGFQSALIEGNGLAFAKFRRGDCRRISLWFCRMARRHSYYNIQRSIQFWPANGKSDNCRVGE